MKLKVDHESVTRPEEEPDEKGSRFSASSAVLLLTFAVIAVLSIMIIAKGNFAERAKPASRAASSAASQTAGKININEADKEELMSLEGIGDKKAEAIIERRETYAPFSDISEIKNVEGIGDGVFEKIKDKITV